MQASANDNKVTKTETEFVIEALSRVKDPYRRYVMTMLIDLLADVVSSTDKTALKKLVELGETLTK